MADSVRMIYQAQYQAMVERRIQLISELESLNNQITKIIKEAKSEKIDLVRISAST